MISINGKPWEDVKAEDILGMTRNDDHDESLFDESIYFELKVYIPAR